MESLDDELNARWGGLAATAASTFGTPCYVTRWRPIAEIAASLDRLASPALPVRSWLSFKTHPLPALLHRWCQGGRGVEVVSECEFLTARTVGVPVDLLLVNGVAKHTWLAAHRVPRLRVHFDSLRELESLLPIAIAARWRVGVRCHAPDERDARDPRFGGQFGMTAGEAVTALRTLSAAGADVQGVHFHLGQRAPDRDAYARAVAHVAAVCRDAAFRPRYLDLGGGLPTGVPVADALAPLEQGIAAARRAFDPPLEEIWLENGRYMTESSTALVVRVVDLKERDDSRYAICDGGRTNHALAADKGAHPLLIVPERRGPAKLTTLCGPTCMTDDVLARLPLPNDLAVGDVIAWLHAGAYHLPWETRFSHGLCAVVWSDQDDALSLARGREQPEAWADAWRLTAA